jgi:hypothetical protein
MSQNHFDNEGLQKEKSVMHEQKEAAPVVPVQEKLEAPVVHGTQKTKDAAEKKNKRGATPGAQT